MTKPTTVRFNENTYKAIEFLKETNKGKFGVPTTAQVLAYAVQLAVYEQVKDIEIKDINVIDDEFRAIESAIAFIDDPISKRILEDKIYLIHPDDIDIEPSGIYK